MSEIDDTDRRILRILEREGRLSNAALSERVGLSASACLRRVQALEASGVIRGYRAVLDPRRLGRGFVAFVTVGLAAHDRRAQAAFEQAMAAAPEVRECYNVAGAVEYLLRVEAADMEGYKRFHGEVLGAAPGVRTLTSYIVMDSPKDERG